MDRRGGEGLDRHPKAPAVWLHLVGHFGALDAVRAQNGRDRRFQRSAMDTLQFLRENLHHLSHPVSRRADKIGARDPRDKKKRTLLGGRTWSTQASGGTIYTGRVVRATASPVGRLASGGSGVRSGRLASGGSAEGVLGSTGDRGAAAPRR